ncbi:MAG: heavy metal translocating P-type ATPase [Halobacteriota archaeon]
MPSCSLCDLPTPDEPVTDEDVDGQFCCRGCLEVTRALGDPDRAETDDRSIRAALTGDETAQTASADDETAHEYLSVEGMHCATCETFLEVTTSSTPGISSVNASYATDTLKVCYDPDVHTPEELPKLVSGMGYTARRRSTASDSEPTGDVEVAKFLVGGGLFGMMTMMWYVLFLYPTYFGYESLVDLGGFDGMYLFTQIWLLTSIVLFYTGYPILRGGYVSLRAGRPNMDLLVSLAAFGSYGYSSLAMVLGRTDLYFDVTVAIILVVTAGNYYESTIKRRASDLLSDLASAQVSEARRPDGSTVPISELEPDDELVVRPGDRIPVDGVVESGVAAVDEALVTGESIPRTKRPGDAVRGGTVVTDQPITIRVDEDASSTLDRIVDLLWEIQSTTPGAQRFADKLATIFVPLVIVLSAATTTLLLATGSGFSTALLVGLTVLIVSCPCALGLATPLAVARGVKTAADRGIVVASEAVFEAATDVDVIALDKTGTLTSGDMRVVETVADEPGAVLAAAATVERASSHPIADAIVAAAPLRTDGDAPETTTLRTDGDTSETTTDGGLYRTAEWTADEIEVFDRGVRGDVDGRDVLVGHPDLFANGWTDSVGVDRVSRSIRERGAVPVVVGWDGAVQGVVGVGDEPKPDWERVVSTLAVDDREIVVLTGDDEAATTLFEDHDAVDQVFAGVPPEAKAETVHRLRSRGTVAMIGDGSNDAPALAAADIGIAMATGTKLATDAGDAIVVDGDLSSVPSVFSIASGTKRRIRQNLGWAFLYNAIAIPLAVGGLLNPLFAAVAMALSSIVVVLNSTIRPID